jgi:hypothetical protein
MRPAAVSGLGKIAKILGHKIVWASNSLVGSAPPQEGKPCLASSCRLSKTGVKAWEAAGFQHHLAIAAGQLPKPDISPGKRRLIEEFDFNSMTFGLSYLIGHVRGSALMTHCHSNGRVCRADQIETWFRSKLVCHRIIQVMGNRKDRELFAPVDYFRSKLPRWLR